MPRARLRAAAPAPPAAPRAAHPSGLRALHLDAQDENGQLMLSRRRILFTKAWDKVTQLYADDAVVEVRR